MDLSDDPGKKAGRLYRILNGQALDLDLEIRRQQLTDENDRPARRATAPDGGKHRGSLEPSKSLWRACRYSI
jgi:hypothetical protein